MFQIHNELSNSANSCLLGILVMKGISNPPSHEALDGIGHKLEPELRKKYGQTTRQELKSIHPMDVYVSYYKRFGYTYHVLLQLESVVHGKAIPSVSVLVKAMFMAELDNMLLTSGHDLEKIKAPLFLKSSTGTENYTGINGKPITTIPGDIMIADSQSVISSILKGPDNRTCIDAKTRQALFTIYAPYGIQESLVNRHLDDMESYIRTFSPDAATYVKKVYGK